MLMNNKLSFGSALVVLCGLAVGPVCQTTQAAEPATASAPAAPALDLARSSTGTQLMVREPGATEESRAAQALIGDDASASYTLGAGTTSMILTLDKIQLLNRLSFANQGAEGRVSVWVSDVKLPVDSAAWHATGAAETFGGSGVVNCDLGSVEARYVKLNFTTRQSGRVATLSLVGLPAFNAAQTVTSAYVGTPEKVDRPSLSVSLNFVNLGSAAKVVGISKASSLGNVQNMKTGNPEAAYTFDPTDATPTLVVDLGSRQSPDHVICAYKAPAGRLDLYLVDNPADRDDQSVSLNYVTAPSVQPVSNDETARSKPAYTITTAGEGNVNRLSADLGGKSGRFLIAEFHPLTGAHRLARSRDGKDFKDYKDLKDAPVAGISDAPVAGIANFGDAASSQAVPLLPPLGTAAITP